MKFKVLFILFLSIISLGVNAQECGFDLIHQELLQNETYNELDRITELKIQNAFNSQARTATSNLLTIPVVVHVLHLGEALGSGTNISDAQILSGIDNLNDFYGGQTANSPIDFNIEFVLAKRTPNCTSSTGINRIDASSVAGYSTNGISFASGPGADQNTLKNLSRWPETDYFNIWIVSEINNNGGGSGYQGYANFFNGLAYEGSVMMHTVFGYDPTNANPSWPLNFNRDNSTVVHEVGHFFHLYHTFQGDGTGADCPADITVGVDSDGCADTVPHRRETSTCPANNSCTGNPWVDDNTINNIMSYYSCIDRLTNDQYTRVRAAMEGTSIVNSKGGEDPDLSHVAPSAVCSTNSVMTLNAGIVSVELNGTTFNSSVSANDGGNIDKSGNCSGYFEIDADVSNTLNVGVSVNLNQLGVWIDWNDDGDFYDEAEQQYLVSGGIASNSVVPIALTYPSNIPYDDYVRIRIINDLDSGYSGVNAIDSPCYSSLVYGQSEDYAIYVMPAPVTYIYNGSWSPANPQGACTSRDSIEIQSGNVSISADLDCNIMTINPGASLSLNSGINLCATAINLNSTSQQFSSLISDGDITGTVHYNRYTSQIGPVGTNDLISAPLQGESFGDFASSNSNLANSGTIRAFAPYNTVSGAYENYDVVTNASSSITSGVGYRAATTDGSSLEFTGSVASVDILNVPITDAAAGYAWNLIGNPYPSYLDFNAFFQLNKSEFDSESAYQAVYGYDGNASNGWIVWNQAVIDDGSITELLAPGQAFFVKAKAGGGLVDFTTNMRVVGSSDDFIAGRFSSSTTSTAYCKINILNDNNNASTQLYFIDGKTRGLDAGYDAASYQGSASEFSIYSHLVEESLGLDMAIQTLNISDLNDVVIPLGVNALATSQLTIGIDNLSTVPQNINVYLEDTQTNIFTLLNDADYVFTPNEDLNGIGRFYLRFSSQVLSNDTRELDDLKIYTTQNPKTLIINGILTDVTTAKLYDIQGRLVLDTSLNQNVSTNNVSLANIQSGVYIVEINNLITSTSVTKKIIIK
ncbi:zinc-dependent metalloprotease [Winogradskyella sp.]|jgi:hypothetical protein|uniref:zinc-dependent metalloprotease n=1 Tax=Winogradskyella sp. TaxID=1883156 RepID=UPI0025CBA2DA|nr:zinc-dependent metalloprotease [Winogradskyella sp.]MCT4629181.1 zinc-dependent metalloprotease [Winogradskyella sp.]